jgi:predicted nucleic acid-binding protein
LILIDSYGWIEYFAEGPLADKYGQYLEKASPEKTVTPTIVLYEVYRKVKKTMGEEKALEAYAQISRTKIVELNESLSLEAADVSLKMNLGMADSIIVATAKAYNAKIITSDKHLKDGENVKFIGGP